MDLELALKLTGEGSSLRGELRATKSDVDKTAQSTDQLDKSSRRAGQGLDEAARGASVFRTQAQAANQTVRAYGAEVVQLRGAIQGVGATAITAAQQNGLLGNSALIAANETASLGAAAALSSSQVAALSGASTTSNAGIAALGATSIASSGGVAALGGSATVSSTGVAALGVSATATAGAVAAAGQAALVYDSNIARIGRSTSLSAGAMAVFLGAANSTVGGVRLIGSSISESRSGLDAWIRSLFQVDPAGRGAFRSLSELVGGMRLFSREAQDAEQVSSRLTGTMRLLGGAVGFALAALSAISLATLIGDMTRTIYESEKLRGSLLSAVGGVPELADRAFTALEQFAEQTPFALEQSVQAFIKMQNLGIRPTEERMRGFGNTAAAMGKDLNQMIEAVADASTGEFERLKEFGIKSSQEGDKVRFTFQGVTTTVGKNSEEIVNYLTNIGNTKFGDAMENQMSRLPGLWSNLKDTIDGIWRDLGDAGVTNLFSDWLRVGIAWTSDIRREIQSGWFEWLGTELGVLGARWSGWLDLAKNTWTGLVALLRDDAALSQMSAQWQDLKNAVVEAIDAVADLPINLQTLAAIGIGEIDKLDASLEEFFGLLGNDASRAWEAVSFASVTAWLTVKQSAGEAVEFVIQRFGDMVSQIGVTLAAINNTGIGDQLVSDSALANIQQAGAAMQTYAGISQGVAADLAVANAEHAKTETALNAERAGIEATAAARKDAANQFIEDSLAQRQEVLNNRAASILEAEGKAASAQASYENKRAQDLERVSIDSVTDALGGAAAATATKTAATKEQVDSLNQLLDRLDPARAAQRQYQADVEELRARLADGTLTQLGYNSAIAALDQAAAKGGSALDKLLDRLDPARAATRQYQADIAVLDTALAGSAITQDQYNTAVGTLDKEARKSRSGLDQLLDRLNPTRAATRQYSEDMAELQAALAAGTISQGEFNTSVAALEVEANKSINGVLPLWETLQTAWKRGVERMDDLAAGWLKNFFLTGKISISGVKELFLEMLAEMVYAAARNKIVLQFATAGNGTLLNAATSAAGATGATVTSPLSTLSSGLTGITNGITAAGARLYESIGNVASDLGLSSIADKAYAKMGSTTGLSLLGDAAGGLAGGYLGSQVYGPTSGIGNTLGGIAGSILIPVPVLGAAIGSFLGGALEAGLNKVFGQKNDGNNAGFASIDLATGAVATGGVGKSFDQKNIDYAGGLAEELKSFAALIGGSSFAGRIDVGNKDGIKFEGQKFKDPQQFLAVAYRAVIEQATDLDETLKDMLLGLTGSAEDLKRNASDAIALFNAFDADNPFFEGIADFETTFSTLTQTFRRDGEALNTTILRLEGGLALLDAAGQDASRSVANFERAAEVIDRVGLETANNILFSVNVMGDGLRKQFKQITEEGARSNLDIYETIVAQNRELIASYDGTVAASAALAQATQVRRQAELALLAEIEAVTASVTGRIASFREQLILDGLDEKGQYDRYRDQISDLASQISTAGSAAQIESITSRIDELGKTAYNLLDDVGQTAVRPEFLTWLDQIEDLATDRLGDIKDDVITTSEAVDGETQIAFWEKAGLAGENLQAAAADLQDAAAASKESQLEAAQRLIDAAGSIEAAARVVRDMMPQRPGVLA